MAPTPSSRGRAGSATPKAAAASTPSEKTTTPLIAKSSTVATTTKSATTGNVIPLPDRSVDYWLVVWYIIFWFTVMWTDLHNFIASFTGRTVQQLEVTVMDKNESLIIPPHFLSYYYFRWARTADPLLYQNPVWWQCIEWVNLLCLMPFAFIAARAFYKGYNWIRTPAIIVSSFTFYSLILCIGTTFFHENPEASRTRQSLIFFFIYVPYLIFPALVTARVWQDAPFSKPLNAVLDRIIKVVASLTYFGFALAGVLWYFRCEISAEAKEACASSPLLADGATVEPWITKAALAVFGFVYGLAAMTIGKFVYDQETSSSTSPKKTA